MELFCRLGPAWLLHLRSLWLLADSRSCAHGTYLDCVERGQIGLFYHDLVLFLHPSSNRARVPLAHSSSLERDSLRLVTLVEDRRRREESLSRERSTLLQRIEVPSLRDISTTFHRRQCDIGRLKGIAQLLDLQGVESLGSFCAR